MKAGKAPELDGFPMEYLKNGGMTVLEWLVRLLTRYMGISMDWHGACTNLQRQG